MRVDSAKRSEDRKLKRLIRSIQCVTAVGALLFSLGIFAAVEGTYVLETDENSSNEGNSTLTIDVDDEGEYSATLKSSSGAFTYTDDVVVDENKFKSTFPYWDLSGEHEITYSGSVENGKLTGTVSGDFEDVVEFAGSLIENTDNTDAKTTDVEKAIEDCFKEITGGNNVRSISRDTDRELEECVNKRVSSPERIRLQYTAAGGKGLVPQIAQEDD